MKNTVIKRALKTDALCRSLFDYRLRVTSCSFMHAYNHEPEEENFTHLYRLCYFFNGEATCFINSRNYVIPEKTALYLPPNHSITLDDKANRKHPATLYFINFEIGNLARRNEFHEMMIQCMPNLMVPDDRCILLKLFEEAFSEASSEKTGACGFIQSLFHMIITHMIRYSQSDQSSLPVCSQKISSTTTLLNQASEYIYDHLRKNIKINQLAKELGISEIYLYKLFKEQTGKSPQQFLADYRIQMAKEFLANPDYSIKMIADELGYCSANHFSTTFKKKTGYAPNEWRQMNVPSNHQ